MADEDESRDDVLHDGRALSESLFEFAPDAIVVIDRTGNIRRANAQVEAMFGYRRNDLLGQSVEVLLPQRFRDRHVQHRVGYFGESRMRPMGAGLELFARRRDGSEFPVDIMLSPVDTAEGPLVLGVVRDITERKRFEQALREKNVELERASLAKDRFLASMSHELRTPLNAVIGFTGTLLMKLPGPLTADQETQLRTIQTSARHLLSLINDLLDLARIQSESIELKFESVVCQDVVAEVGTTLRPLAEAKGLAFDIRMPEEALLLRTDRRALSQILINLMNNAIKFTESGAVRVGLERRRENGRRWVEVSVADTGVGIKAEDHDKLFQAFTQVDPSSTRRYEGTGLGLHLSKKLAELIDGTIHFSSEHGKGSTFTLLLDEGGAAPR